MMSNKLTISPEDLEQAKIMLNQMIALNKNMEQVYNDALGVKNDLDNNAEKALSDMKSYESSVKSYASQAQTSEANAKKSADNCKVYEANCKTSEANASTSAQNASEIAKASGMLYINDEGKIKAFD